MSRVRVGIAAGMVIGLAGLLGAVWVGSRTPPATAAATTSTASTTVPEPSTTREATTTSASADREAEVQQILQRLWFGWFDAIYRKDPDALWQVVATQKKHDEGVAAMQALDFTATPTLGATQVRVDSLLLDRPDCLVVQIGLSIREYLGTHATTSSVDVLWPQDQRGWRLATRWKYASDRWLSDCDDVRRDRTP